LVRHLIFGLSVFLAIPYSVSLAQPITPSGLNTAVSAPIPLTSGQTQFDITGGTRPGGGLILFHSFGDFTVPNNNIANFLNETGLPTSNILGRVTGGNISNIFGTVQTTNFVNANLFLMNPSGFLFGPNATINVGGMVAFTSAEYLRLADGASFKAIPNATADALLSAAPVAAFGFLGSNPGAITVQGSQLSVAEGTGISLVGGNITVQAGTLTAPSGQINLVSVGKPSHPNVGGKSRTAGNLPRQVSRA
jgi:filamentous hemagglutinin family protein